MGNEEPAVPVTEAPVTPPPAPEQVPTANTEEVPLPKAEDNRIHYVLVGPDGVERKRFLADILQNGDCYISAGKLIFKYAALQKIAKLEGIVEKKFETSITPMASNHQQHGVNLWLGFKGDNNPDNWVRGSGEASALNTGIQVTGQNGQAQFIEVSRIDSRYKYAMADKRAFSRALLKMIGMFNAYGDVEAKEFEMMEQEAQKAAKAAAAKATQPPAPPAPANAPAPAPTEPPQPTTPPVGEPRYDM